MKGIHGAYPCLKYTLYINIKGIYGYIKAIYGAYVGCIKAIYGAYVGYIKAIYGTYQ